VKDRLHEPGTGLSGGQQQRLCIARAIAVSPEVILMDEPCSALDPIATARIEDLIDELRLQYSIVIVTHAMQQASRVSQRTAYFHLGDLIESARPSGSSTNPRHRLTEDYITGVRLISPEAAAAGTMKARRTHTAGLFSFQGELKRRGGEELSSEIPLWANKPCP